MGQYWVLANLDKKECVWPHGLGAGLKLWEQLANHPSTGTALIVLCAAMPERRGGGDLDLDENWHGGERHNNPAYNLSPAPMPDNYADVARATIGRWAGDRIAFIGDYAEEGDLPKEFEADRIYWRCHSKEDHERHIEHINKDIQEAWATKNEDEVNILQDKKASAIEDMQSAYRDITDMVAAVIEHELDGKFVGDGWKQFERNRRD